METSSHLEMYKDLVESYLELKPVLFDLNKQNNNRYPEAILNEIRALNDHIARCYLPHKTDDEIKEELRKAEGHLKRLIFDSFKQLNIIFHDTFDLFETKYYGPHWLTFDNGCFWKNYSEHREKITFLIEKAKNAESSDSEKAANYYQEAYILQGKVKDLIEQNRSTLEGTWLSKAKRLFTTNIAWFITTVVLAVVPALLWEVITHWNTIYSLISNSFFNCVKTVGEWLVNIVS